MLLSKQADFGGLRVIIFDFEVAGDVLPFHVHDEKTVHITIVTRGKIKAYSHDWEKEASAGATLDFRPNEPHEIVALEDNTRIINVAKNSFDPTT
jgi:quercetin dioxygenase-like cupin family protein